MNKVHFLTIGVVLLFILNIGMIIYLFNLREHQKQLRTQGADVFIIEQLKLDGQQQRSFADLRRQHHETIRTAQDEDRHLHDLYFDLLKTDHPNKTKVDSVAGLIAEQRKVIEAATFNHFQQLRSLCRTDQKKLFDATIDEIAHRMAPGRPGGPGPGPDHDHDGPPPPPDR